MLPDGICRYVLCDARTESEVIANCSANQLTVFYKMGTMWKHWSLNNSVDI